jgi:putative ATPase
MVIPLAEKLRPQQLENFIGQEHLTSENAPIFNLIKNKAMYSMIFWGPPGTGKTTLARIIADNLNLPLYEFSAVNTGLAQLKEVLVSSQKTYQIGLGETQNVNKTKLFFIDEIHRFNKAQQDFLLPYVENGTIVLIGATTENPSFEVINALLSRCKVYVFNRLDHNHLAKMLQHCVETLKFGVFNDVVKDKILEFSNGDGRKLINTVEQIKYQEKTFDKITIDDLTRILTENSLKYDQNGEEHYNTISAFIKSMRFSDVDATLYYLARMLQGGEDPKFIVRRMIVFASEDIGLANTNALTLAMSAKDAIDFVGMPEAQINLSHIAVYLALSKKSRDTYNAYFKAVDSVVKHGNIEIPMHLRNAPTKLMKNLGYGAGYGKVKGNLPDKIKDEKYFEGN